MKISIIKNITVVSFFVLLIAGTFSCSKKWLDERSSKSLAVPQTLQDFQAIMDDADNIMNMFSPSLGEVGTDGHYVRDEYFESYMAPLEKNAYTWSRLSPYVSIVDWGYSYQRIFNCNLVLEGIEKIKSLSSDPEWRDIKGQALFQRARTFYEIAQIWSPMYDESIQNEKLGIPLRTESDINIKSERSTLKETYERILNDLLEAKDLLSVSGLYKTRPDRKNSLGMLARIYLSMEDYENAARFSDSCLNYYHQIINYNSLDSTAAYPFPLPTVNEEVLFHSYMLYTGAASGDAFIDSSFYNDLEQNDLRKPMLFIKNTDGSINFKGNYSGSILPWNGVAINEIYLIRSESLARKGEIEEAMNVLNTLLSNRWKEGTFIPYTSSTEEDALRKILLERRRELLFRGLIWSDLRRLNRDTRFQKTLERTNNGETFTIEPNTYKYTLPLPEEIVQMTGMNQNPGWGW